jgi:hypothetical protein
MAEYTMEEADEDDDLIVDLRRSIWARLGFSAIGIAVAGYLVVTEFHNLFIRLLVVLLGGVAAVAPFFYGLKEIRIGKSRLLVDYGFYRRVLPYKDLGTIEVYTELNPNDDKYGGLDGIETIRINSRRGLSIAIRDERINPNDLKADIEERATEMVKSRV